MIVPVILLYLAEWAMLDEGNHMALHRQLGAARNTGLTDEGVGEAMRALDEYLWDRRADIDLTASVYGIQTEVFNDREKAHMKDVKALFEGGRRIRAVLFAAGGALLIVGAALARGKTARARLAACLFWAALLGALGIACAVRFEAVFLRFHALCFDNDLWLLDPRTDLMIRLLPEAFFEAVARRAALWMAGGLAATTALCAVPVLLKLFGRKQKA